MINHEGDNIPLDKEGFLRQLEDWSPAVAERLAANESIELTKNHWQIIDSIRDFYQQFDHSPAMRPLVKFLGQQLPDENINSIYLLQLFPGSPAKLAAKIAGLPKPSNCL